MRSSLAIVVVGLLLGTGCGGRGSHASSPRTPAGSAAAPAPDATTPPSSPTDDECEGLAGHIADLAVATAAAAHPDAPPSAAEIASTRTSVLTMLRAQCPAMTREVFGCAMAASSPAELDACDPAPATDR